MTATRNEDTGNLLGIYLYFITLEAKSAHRYKANNTNFTANLCTLTQTTSHKLGNLLLQLIHQLDLTLFHPPKHTKFASIFKKQFQI